MRVRVGAPACCVAYRRVGRRKEVMVGIRTRALGWALGGQPQERLLWVDREGRVVDLGAYTSDDLEALHWGVCIAYRTTRSREERQRLARVRLLSGRLVGALRGVRPHH